MNEQPKIVVALTVHMSTVLLGDRLHKLSKRGFDVHVVVGDSIPLMDTSAHDITYHLVGMSRSISPLRDLGALREWFRLMKELRPVALVGATPKAALLSLVAGRLAHVPIRVLELWGAAWDGSTGIRRHLLRFADRVSIACATNVIAVSNSLADLVVDSGLSRDRPIVLGQGGSKGVRLDTFQTVRKVWRDNQPIIGFFGRVASDKGANSLPAVMRHVRTVLPSAQLLIVGAIDASDPPSQETVDFLNHDPLTTISGWLSDPATSVGTFDVLLFPSKREGLPNAVLEAAACGIPTVAFESTGTRDAIRDEKTGFLVPLGDHQRLADRIVQILKDETLREFMSIRCVEFVHDFFDSRTVEALNVNYLASLIENLDRDPDFKATEATA